MHLVEHLRAALTGLHAAWVMWLLAGLSFVSMALIAERALFFRSIGASVDPLAGPLDQQLQAGDYQRALSVLLQSASIAAAVTVAGLTHAHLGPLAAEKAIAGAISWQRLRMDRGLAFLGTLGNNAPFVGLLGTVIGVIEAFEALGSEAAGAPGANLGMPSQAIMGGIAEALVATAVGLFVAIPSVASYNYFQRRIAIVVGQTDTLVSVLLAHLYAEDGLHVPAQVTPASQGDS